MEQKTEIQQIDLEAVIKSRQSKILNMLPQFVINYMKRAIQQEFINNFLRKHHDKFGLDFVNISLQEFGIKLEVKGVENVPRGKQYIFASNHPQGGLDAVALMKLVEDNFGHCRFIANNLLLFLRNFEPLLLGVNKHGRTSMESITAIENAFKSGFQMLFFPSGLVSRRIKGKIVDLPWHHTFINRAIKHKIDVVPVHISGRNSNFFYRFARFRELLGIKTNIEMIYLPGEMIKANGSTYTLTFGKPIAYSTFDKSLSRKQWAARVREQVYALAEDKE